MKILIIRLSSIGDCVLASPVIEALLEHHPAAHLAWAVQSKSVPVVRGLPGLAEIMLWDDRRRGAAALVQALWRTWRSRFDVALDLQGLDKAALFTMASRARRRVSGDGARKLAHWCSNERVSEKGPLHARLFYLRRAASLGIADDAADRFFPRVPVTSAQRRFAAEFLAQIGPAESRYVALNLGAARPLKRWPSERFASLADRLLEADARVRIVVCGSHADLPLVARFESTLADIRSTRAGSAWSGRILVAAGRTNLMELAGISERCSAFVTADTGPMHIAAAVGAPVVALFGPTDSAVTGPVHKPGAAPIRVLCGRDWHGSWPAPMSALQVDEVARAVEPMIS